MREVAFMLWVCVWCACHASANMGGHLGWACACVCTCLDCHLAMRTWLCASVVHEELERLCLDMRMGCLDTHRCHALMGIWACLWSYASWHAYGLSWASILALARLGYLGWVNASVMCMCLSHTWAIKMKHWGPLWLC